MIHKIYASDDRFKPILFKKGLNVILAERSENSGDRDTRNGAGKTTLIHIIHFCFGADPYKLNLPTEEIKDWVFFIELDLCGKRITASRCIDNPRTIFLNEEVDGLAIPISKDDETGELFYKNDDWKKLLGISLFGLREHKDLKYAPSFRSLFPYFVRRSPDAYITPFKHFDAQKTYDKEMNNAYLLGLNWEHISDAQNIRDQENAIKILNSSIKAGFTPTQGELEAERIRLENKISLECQALENFQVHPQYEELQNKANSLTETIHQLSNKILILRRKLASYEDSVKSEESPTEKNIEDIYREAGLCFGKSIKKTLIEAKLFHETIIKNRRKFLQTEIVEIKSQIESNENSLYQNSEERSSVMRILQTHGALKEFSLLQDQVTRERSLLDKTNIDLLNIKKISENKKDIKSRKLILETKLQRDYEERRNSWEQSVTLFNENSLALYKEPGNLIINLTEIGYTFDVQIPKSTSEGVGKMKIFCYDLMLVERFSQKKKIDFLVHDSTIYDGVDSRQRAHALLHASERAESGNFQYICMLNSDMIPHEDFEDGFDIQTYIRIKLGDQNPEESLLGFHFELKKVSKKR